MYIVLADKVMCFDCLFCSCMEARDLTLAYETESA